MKGIKRVFLFVVDSMGCGSAPDAALYGDEGANTLRSISGSPKFICPNMERLGLFSIDGFKPGNGSTAENDAENAAEKLTEDAGVSLSGIGITAGKAADIKAGKQYSAPKGCFARLRERSAGKDTTAGHWEIAGLVTEKPFPTYPDGFPQSIIDEFEQRTGCGTLCNKVYSGTEVIRDYGEEHLRTGKLIVYTSADSVFQIAAHEDIVPPEKLYEYCRTARAILTGEHGVGRVIARPFIGTNADNFKRVGEHRHDFSITPPGTTMLDELSKAGYDTIGIGKIRDIFAGKGLESRFTAPTASNEDGMEKTLALMNESFKGLCFVNLVETDSVFGHRRDIDGYAEAVSAFDERLGQVMERLKEEDIIIITADHGCDPGFKGTDHTREYVPMLIYGKMLKAGIDLGTRDCFGDIAATVLDMFGISYENITGLSFLDSIL